MKKIVLAVGLVVVAFLAIQPASAQGGQMEAKGTVTDHEGNPLQGVIVTYTAESNPALEYTGKTNKKGRYFIPGLFTAKEGDMWQIAVDSTAVGDLVLIKASRRMALEDVLKDLSLSKPEGEAAVAS